MRSRMRDGALTDISRSRRGACAGQACRVFPLLYAFSFIATIILNFIFSGGKRNPKAPELLYCMREFN